MGRKSVAVLNVRSSEISLIIGERGVNGTFVFKAECREEYDGYAEGKFFNEEKLSETVFALVSDAERICGERLKEIFVGVPGAFVKVVPKEQTVSFPKRRRIGQREIDLLYESGKEPQKGYRFLRASSMIFITADNRRVVDPAGLVSAKLSGLLSYFYCADYFAETMEKAFGDMGIALRYLPTEFATATYLIPSETRDEYSLFLDSGFLSSTACVLLGSGVLAQRTFWTGSGQIVVRVMERFSLPYRAALELLRKANLFVKKNAGRFEFEFGGESYFIDSDMLVETVKEGLDELCEAVGGFFEECAGRELDYKPLYLSGEGITQIRGASEHVSKRLNRVVEELSPSLPYYNKPSMSAQIALIDMASDDKNKSRFLNRLFGGFGG